ncbi:MAG: CopG family transcriptional regulator [Clostridium argentinense]|nr:CopG family transcriptional regulator [Clostridium argentinense]
MAVKDEVIRVRVSKAQKELFKKVAKNSGISMSELMVVATKNVATQKEEYNKSREVIELRAVRMENEIQELKKRLKIRSVETAAEKKKHKVFKFIRKG